jgi:signal transduction histidine kinase
VHKVGGKDHHRGEEARQMAAAGTGSGAPPGAGAETLAAGLASPGGLRPVLGALVSPRTWLAVTHLLAGLVIGLVSFTVVVTGISLGIALLPVFLVGIPVLVAVIWLAGLGARAERARFAVLLGAEIPAPPPLPDEPTGWRRVNLLFLARTTWLPTVYALVRLPLSVIEAVVVTSVWGIGLALLALPAYNGALPGGSAHLGSFALNNAAWVALGVATGVALLLGAAPLTRVAAAGDAAVARWLLGPGRRARLTERIGELETSRAGVVDAAETERRRIERDLHDGAQQRLVSLAMELGRARAKFASDPQAAEAIVGQAHEQAKEALTELRNLVRGVHPPVLSDRGLDAALSGLAALSPVPVTVQVDLPGRPSASLEAIAYFVVAEALTNVAKHAKASRALVTVTRSGDLLNVAISDDGIGGASLAGQGLSGLAARVAGIDGRLLVTSPDGGPTVIEAVLPCG